MSIEELALREAHPMYAAWCREDEDEREYDQDAEAEFKYGY